MPLSPILFNVFINDLIVFLNQEANGINFGTCQINALVYADDLVLIADKSDILNKLLLTLNQWCIENRMCINPDKTRSFTLDSRRSKNVSLHLHAAKIALII